MNRESILERVRRYVHENFLYMRPGFRLEDDDSLLGNGVIDSMGVMELTAFLEEEFAVSVLDEDITERHLGTLSAVASFVEAKLGRSEAAA